MSKELMDLVDEHAANASRATSVCIFGNPRRGFELGRETDAIREQLAKQVVALEAERDHWKANHDNQVERARVLTERTDMPLERVRAYRQIGDLQRLVDVQKMLLGAFDGTLTRPEGVDPFKDDAGETPQFEASYARLREAYCVQQPSPVPDQMALVWRADVMRLTHRYIHRNAYFENNRLTEAKIVQNEAGEVVAVTRTDAQGQIKAVIWEKQAWSTVTVPPKLEGTWMVTQPNGKSFLVHSSMKVQIARDCAYTVRDLADDASGQSNQCRNRGNTA
jgi:hypothetical protein